MPKINVMVPKEISDRLDRVAKIEGKNRSEMARIILEGAVKSLKGDPGLIAVYDEDLKTIRVSSEAYDHLAAEAKAQGKTPAQIITELIENEIKK